MLFAVKNNIVNSPATELDANCEAVWSRIETVGNKPLFIESFIDDPEVIKTPNENVKKLTAKDSALPNIVLKWGL